MFNEDLIKNKIYYKYVQDILSGKIPSCEYVKLACQRFLDNLKREDIFFNPDAVTKVCKFISKLKHFKGKSNGKSFILEPFQAFITADVFGWFKYITDEKTGEVIPIRMRNTVYVEMARKQGKTALIAAYALYGLLYDQEPSAEVICSANTRDQAKTIYDLCTGFAKSLDPQGKYLKILRSGIEYKKTNSILKIVSADASKLDGLSVSLGICDEYMEAVNTKMFDVLKSSQGFRYGRRNGGPLMMVITTAGFDKTSACYEMRQTNISILKGLLQDDGRFCIIYTLDEEDLDTWDNPKNFIKCAPNLGVTVSSDYMKEQIISGKNNPGELRSVQTKTLNIWTDSMVESWIPDNYILDCMRLDGKKFVFDFERYRGGSCYIGVDLASVNDITGCVFEFYDEELDKFVYKSYAFLPEDTIRNHPNREMYQKLLRQGYLIQTPGNTVDYDYIVNLILKVQRDYDLTICNLLYDPWQSTSFIQKITEAGVPTEKCSQGIGNMSPTSKEMQKNILQGRVLFDANPIVSWMWSNCIIKEDVNGNIRVTKAHQNNKIDIPIATIISLFGYLLDYGQTPQIFSLSESN